MSDGRFTHDYSYVKKSEKVFMAGDENMAQERNSITIDAGMVNYAFQNGVMLEIGMVGLIFTLQFTSEEEAKRSVDRIQGSLGSKVFLQPVKIDKEIV